MTAPISIVEDDLFTQLGNLIAGLITAPVVRGLDNRVPMPDSPFIVMTGAGLQQMAQPVQTYGGAVQSLALSSSMQWNVGIDCYGPDAQSWAVIIASALRSPYAVDNLANVAPLYATDPLQMPLVDGESQYTERWRFDAALQYTPVVTLPQQSATALNLNVISVDPTYPPGA